MSPPPELRPKRDRRSLATRIWLLLSALLIVAADSGDARARQPEAWDVAKWRCDQCRRDIKAAVQPCSLAAQQRGKFGDVLVRLEPTSHNDATGFFTPVRTSAEATVGLESKDALCVKEKVDHLDCAGSCYVTSHSLDIAVSEPRPLLPPASELLPIWRRYLEGSCWLTNWWRRRALSRILADDVRITPERCLWIPHADNLRAGLYLWLDQSGKQIPFADIRKLKPGNDDPRWPLQWDDGRLLADGQTILVDGGALIDPATKWREYDGTAGIRVCLRATELR